MSATFLTDGEIALIADLLGPGRIKARARLFDVQEQAVLGARAAWYEAREQVRETIRLSGERAKATPEEIAETEAMFDLDGQLQSVSVLDLPYWRSLATLCSPNGPWPVVSHVWMPFEATVQRSRLRGACLVALSECLEANPALNRAYLEGAIWQRHSPEILVPVRFGADDLGAVVVDVRQETPRSAWGVVREGRVKLRQRRKHPLNGAFERLLAQWVWDGFIASPAAAMLSDIGGSGIYAHPTPAFVGANGIPISIVVGDSRGDTPEAPDSSVPPSGCWVGIGVDHRVFDPAEVGPLHRAFDTRVPELLA